MDVMMNQLSLGGSLQPHTAGELQEALDAWERKQGRAVSREEFGERIVYLQDNKPGYLQRVRKMMIGSKPSSALCELNSADGEGSRTGFSRLGQLALATGLGVVAAIGMRLSLKK